MTENKEHNKRVADYLKRAYVADPCKVLPNAFWKTRDRLPGLRCTYCCAGDEGGERDKCGEGGIHRSMKWRALIGDSTVWRSHTFD